MTTVDREPLNPDGRCDACTSVVSEAEADLAPDPPPDHLSERARRLRELGEAS